ncbi:uncharacterized protein SPPG_05618 [Spizellomyces punctatus DAOM BR117]|uniref:glutathione transferase n=1 Tax=Spizellomyces punctatus (strain DAOM BR117) TaxID=645134 RepID=A0A0L0HF18_SPIPD|nr:uncharacterized protein SPPG_05618 [Spizellomyces punctatus DAOM BR117]KNC99373.1 hypothetical protein SPPG_05618 [Spizellomyces punctatus DAOM BR117]|eukprot:XP_016607413.1 hypothetical protein SPPG_05618 [Spizellomyces punctatus DAOM BR117]
MSEFDKVTLTYFGLQGRAEAIRLLLEDAGIPYDDVRIVDRDQWLELKKDTDRFRFGQMPMVDFNGFCVVQSATIMRFIASRKGYYGDTPQEHVLVDMLADGTEDLQRLYLKAVYSDDAESTTVAFLKNEAPAKLEYFEKILSKANGGAAYFTGPKATFADIFFFDLLDRLTTLHPTILDPFPLLKAFKTRVAERPNIKKYHEANKRPQFVNNPFSTKLGSERIVF